MQSLLPTSPGEVEERIAPKLLMGPTLGLIPPNSLLPLIRDLELGKETPQILVISGTTYLVMQTENIRNWSACIYAGISTVRIKPLNLSQNELDINYTKLNKARRKDGAQPRARVFYDDNQLERAERLRQQGGGQGGDPPEEQETRRDNPFELPPDGVQYRFGGLNGRLTTTGTNLDGAHVNTPLRNRARIGQGLGLPQDGLPEPRYEWRVTPEQPEGAYVTVMDQIGDELEHFQQGERERVEQARLEELRRALNRIARGEEE